MQELAEREAILGETNLASKLTRSHLDMFTLKLSMPSAHSFAICCHSGATSAAPAYAASMCTHIRCHSFFSCNTALISAKRSTAQVLVVPSVVARKNGSSPSRSHSSNTVLRAWPVIAISSSSLVGTERNRLRIPRANQAYRDHQHAQQHGPGDQDVPEAADTSVLLIRRVIRNLHGVAQ